MRLCTQYIRANNKKWKDEETEKRKKQEEREDRLAKVAEKQGKIHSNMTQRKITETLNKIPETDRKKLLLEEERKRKIELKYIKENMWKK